MPADESDQASMSEDINSGCFKKKNLWILLRLVQCSIILRTTSLKQWEFSNERINSRRSASYTRIGPEPWYP